MATPDKHPALWNVPYKRNPYFTGRDEMLDKLHRSLHADRAVALAHPLGISGLGGIGKTQMALEYAYRYGQEYEAVFWVRSDSNSSLISSFLELARLLQLPEQHTQNQERVTKAVLRWLSQHSRWLMIFDNMDDLPLATPYLPTAAAGHIIFTTRAHGLNKLAQRLEVARMEPETGALLLLRRAALLPLQERLHQAERPTRDLACSISREVDGLPLALDQAGAYIKETPCSLEQYLSFYKERSIELLQKRGKDQSEYPASVATTWSLSFERVALANPAAAELLTLCAFLAPDAIPETIFAAGADYLGDILAPVAGQKLLFNQACSEALRYSLISREGDEHVLSMHRLVQTVLRENTPVKSRGIWRLLPSTSGLRKTAATQREWKLRAVLAVHAAGPDETDLSQWNERAIWLPHALVCADWIEQEHLYYQESTDMLSKAGRTLEAQARYEEAEQVYNQVLAMLKQHFDPMHPYMGMAIANLGSLHQQRGNYSEAEKIFRKVLAIFEQWQNKTFELNIPFATPAGPQWSEGKLAIYQRLFKISQDELAIALNNLALTCQSQGKHKEAEALQQRLLNLYEQQSGAVSSNEARFYAQMSDEFREKENYTKAEAWAKQGLDIQRRKFGTLKHPDTILNLNRLGMVYRDQKRYKEAEDIFRQTLEISEQFYGKDHPGTATHLDNLAVIYYFQQKYTEAEPLWRQALQIWDKYNLPEAVYTFNNLALMYQDQGKDTEAEALFKRSIAYCEQHQGFTGKHLANLLHNLTLLYQKQNKFHEALSLVQRALELAEKDLGTEHRDIANYRRTQANIVQMQAMTGPVRDPQPAPSAPTTELPAVVVSLRKQAEKYADQQKYAEAEACAKRVLELLERRLDARHPEVLSALNDLARVYRLQKKYNKADPLLKRVLEHTESQESESVETASSLNNLARNYYAQGQYKAAEPLMKRALLIWEKRLGRDDPQSETAHNNYQAILRALNKERQ